MGDYVMENEVKNTLGSRIRQERLKKGWTIEHLSELVDLSPSSLGLVERSNRALSIEKLYAVSRVLEVTTDSLLNINSDLENTRADSIMALVRDLSDKEFEFVMDIIRTMRSNFKNNSLKSGN